MAMVLGLFLGGCVTAIPVVTGVAEGVSYQKQQNEEAANETRMIKFNINISCDGDHEYVDEVDKGILVLRHNKVWIVLRDKDNKPIPPEDNVKPPLHAFAGFYIQYPDDDRFPAERGLVSTISDDPPMLNWIYVDRSTYELRYGNRSGSIEHIVGEWDWTEDEGAVTLEGWEGFVAVDEGDGDGTEWGKEGLRWAVYFDRDDNALKGKVGKKSVLEIIMERKLQSEADQLKQLEDANRKMQVKTQGDMKTQFTAPAADAKRKKVWGK
ncbi:hypothetical protein BCR34DRAFT_480195 [Clohesyomyces aquaticus]|uniref:Uncharacterized protein n=1 Tax=Clohesyomyces aquaticus TaxID=1231657 RepID=A0A1Y1ZUM1_9PLEO|nr:hypothetical protein BCR34DRAFT_480195 [Clohesyomyces aquaticus]